MLSGLAAWCDRRCFRKASLILTVSPYLRRRIAELGIAADKILVLPNAVDKHTAERPADGSSVRDRFGLENCVVIGFAGWFVRWHGLKELLDRFAELDPVRNNLRLLLVGYSAMVLTIIPYYIAMGLGRVGCVSVAAAAYSGLMLAAWTFWIPRYGILGAAMGFCAAQVLVSPCLVAYITLRVARLPLHEYLLESWLRPAAATLVIFAIAFSVRSQVFRLWSLALVIALMLTAYYALSLLLLDDDDKDILRKMLRIQ